MKSLLNMLGVLAMGIALVSIVTFTEDLAEHQRGYTEGRASVLNTIINVGSPASPCSVKIPLSALAEMVSVGLINWHAVCLKETDDETN